MSQGVILIFVRKLLQDAGNPVVDAEISVSDILNGLLVQTAELMQAQLKKVNINLRINPIGATAAGAFRDELHRVEID